MALFFALFFLLIIVYFIEFVVNINAMAITENLHKKNLVSIQRVLYYRAFAPLIRGAKHAEGFIIFIFAERAKINKPKPFG